MSPGGDRPWLPPWFEQRDGNVWSVDDERDRPRKHVLSPKLARIPLEDMRRADILSWLRELEGKHVDEEGQRLEPKLARLPPLGEGPRRVPGVRLSRLDATILHGTTVDPPQFEDRILIDGYGSPTSPASRRRPLSSCVSRAPAGCSSGRPKSWLAGDD
jgi:hypothetical protein